MDIIYDYVPAIRERLLEMEDLRDDAYQLESSFKERLHYLKRLESQKYVALSAYYQNELVAGCYVSDQFSTLYIQQLFVGYNWQGKHYHFGRLLLLETLKRREELEQYFKKEFWRSQLVAYDERSKKIYKNVGYVPLYGKGNIMVKKLTREVF